MRAAQARPRYGLAPLKNPVTPGLGARFVRGAIQLGAASWTTYALNFGVVLLIARWIGPEAWGIYALAVAVNEFISIVGGFAIAPALVQSRDESQQLFDTGYAMSLGLALIALVVAACVAPLLWKTRGAEPALFLLLLGVARIFVLLSDVAFASLDRVFRYGPMALIQLSAQSGPSVAALGLAWVGLGAWSLILRDLGMALLTFGLTHWQAPRRFRLRLERESFRRITSFSAPFLLARTLDIVLIRFDRLLVGSAMGNAPLGIYDRARYLAEAGVLATAPLARVTLNLYSRLQDDRGRLARAYALVNFAMIRVLFAGAATLLVFPEATIRLLLGAEWSEAAPLLRILALHAALCPILDNMKVMLYARAQMAANVRLRLVQLAVFLPGVGFGAWRGDLEIVAAATLGATLVGVLTASLQTRSLLGSALVGLYAAPLTALAATAAALLALHARGGLDAAPFWLLPFLPPILLVVLLTLIERGRLLRELGYLRAQLASAAEPREDAR